MPGSQTFTPVSSTVASKVRPKAEEKAPPRRRPSGSEPEASLRQLQLPSQNDPMNILEIALKFAYIMFTYLFL